MQNQRKEINTENKELKILYNLITKIILIPGGIPKKLQHKVTELGHKNHLGIAKEITLPRKKNYFDNMEAKVEAKISECILCAGVSKISAP